MLRKSCGSVSRIDCTAVDLPIIPTFNHGQSIHVPLTRSCRWLAPSGAKWVVPAALARLLEDGGVILRLKVAQGA